MSVSFKNVHTPEGLKHLDEYLMRRSYITGYLASKDDITVYCALSGAPSSDLINASRWYSHISALIESIFSGPAVGVTVKGGVQSAPETSAPPAPQTPSPAEEKPAKEAEDDDDMDLFGEETEEEKAAAAAREAAKKSSAKKKESGKSSVLLDVKPWDDETDMKKLEEAVRSVQMPGLFWGASKFVPVFTGIKKLQIMMTIEDDLVSVDDLIEDHLTSGPGADFIQSCDIVAFNKI